MTLHPTDSAAPYDPAGEVPEGYEVFCEACGYSLMGITADRCPECGHAYDLNELPFARVPWLHRRRIGWWAGYLSTVRLVLFSPNRFARELTRPVRISAADARRFRQTTLRIALGSYLIAMAVVMFLTVVNNRNTIAGWQAATMAIVFVTSAVAAACFLLIATDMPLFIWKGLPSKAPHELAPVHHYASAPLALIPLLALVVIGGACAMHFAPNERTLQAVMLISLSCVAGVFLALWIVALCLMKSATGCPPSRVVGLALYLPLHWVLTFAVAFLGFALVMMMAEPLIKHGLR